MELKLLVVEEEDWGGGEDEGVGVGRDGERYRLRWRMW